jgi:serine-aspartate repeat-containing protein C/D/E
VVPGGYQCSLPTAANNCEYTHTVTENQSVTGDNFGNFRLASISGLKFEDTNGNGIQDGVEGPLSGVTIYLDANGNDTFDDPVSTTTAADGTYSFINLVPGNYSVREVPPAGSVCTAPSPSPALCEYNFTPLTSGTSSTGNNFGNAQPGTISGTKFKDVNGNGTQDPGDDPLGGVTIYLDANGNDAFDAGEPSTTTLGDGTWSLTNIAPGSRTVREVEPSGYKCTAPSTTFANCEFTVSLTSGGSVSTPGPFGNALAPTLSGSKFEDSNANGIKDIGELPISGVTIYLDEDGSNTLNGTERSTTTDVNGLWSFTVLPGNYTVREDPPTGSECSTPGTIGDPDS